MAHSGGKYEKSRRNLWVIPASKLGSPGGPNNRMTPLLQANNSAGTEPSMRQWPLKANVLSYSLRSTAR